MKKLLLALVAIAMTADMSAVFRRGSCASCPSKSCETKACPTEECPKCVIKCQPGPCEVTRTEECKPRCFKTVCREIEVAPNEHEHKSYSCPSYCPRVVQGNGEVKKSKHYKKGVVASSMSEEKYAE